MNSSGGRRGRVSRVKGSASAHPAYPISLSTATTPPGPLPTPFLQYWDKSKVPTPGDER